MLELLKKRMTEYTYEKSAEFRSRIPYVDPKSLERIHSYETLGLPEDPFGMSLWIIAFHNRKLQPWPIYEKFNNGYFSYTNMTGVYFDFDSDRIYKLSRTQLDHDWELHTHLYELTKNNNNVRIEIPLKGERLIINDTPFWYTIVERQNLVNLSDIHLTHVTHKMDTKFLMSFIDLAAEKASYIKQLNDKYQLGCLAMGSVINKFNVETIDPLSGVWSDFKHWNVSFDQYMFRNYETIEEYVKDYMHPELMNENDGEKILAYARAEFNKV